MLVGGGGLHGDSKLHHQFSQGKAARVVVVYTARRAAKYGKGWRGEQLVNSVSLSLSLSLSKLNAFRDLGPLFCFVLIQWKGNDEFFFSRFFLFSFNFELKKNAKWRRFSGSNSSTS